MPAPLLAHILPCNIEVAILMLLPSILITLTNTWAHWTLGGRK